MRSTGKPVYQLQYPPPSLPPKESLARLQQRIERVVQSYDRILPVLDRLGDAKFAEREAADKDLRGRFAEIETSARLYCDFTASGEAKRRINAMLPDLTPREKDLRGAVGFQVLDPRLRLKELKNRYGDDYMFYPDTPGSAEFRSVSRVFAVLERMDSPEVKTFLEVLAKRPAGDWFAVKADASLKRMKR